MPSEKKIQSQIPRPWRGSRLQAGGPQARSLGPAERKTAPERDSSALPSEKEPWRRRPGKPTGEIPRPCRANRSFISITFTADTKNSETAIAVLLKFHETAVRVASAQHALPTSRDGVTKACRRKYCERCVRNRGHLLRFISITFTADTKNNKTAIAVLLKFHETVCAIVDIYRVLSV